MAKTVLLSRAGMAHLALAAALVGASYLVAVEEVVEVANSAA